MEIWKLVIGYEGLYEVSNFGNVKSLPKRRGRYVGITPELILKNNLTDRGYCFVVLSKNNKCTRFRVHRLVALHFIPNIGYKPHINHKNGVKTDNKVENLEWCTLSENSIHAIRMGLKSMKPAYDKNKKPVQQIDLQGNIIKEFESVSEAGRITGVNNIKAVLYGKQKTSGGYFWKRPKTHPS